MTYLEVKQERNEVSKAKAKKAKKLMGLRWLRRRWLSRPLTLENRKFLVKLDRVNGTGGRVLPTNLHHVYHTTIGHNISLVFDNFKNYIQHNTLNITAIYKIHDTIWFIYLFFFSFYQVSKFLIQQVIDSGIHETRIWNKCNCWKSKMLKVFLPATLKSFPLTWRV